ncbi:odorant receptor 46a-like isoform X1 [Vespula maculifrons]|uniref:Odorant receptor 46a-like isoform X1 n=1 Tax=Vespula maculifrons TaxID=7453 RepID=A0ABD2BC63_VESMC
MDVIAEKIHLFNDLCINRILGEKKYEVGSDSHTINEESPFQGLDTYAIIKTLTEATMTLKEIDYFEKYSSILNEHLFTFIGLYSYIKSPKELLRVHLINFVLAFATFMQFLELYFLYKLGPKRQLRVIVKIKLIVNHIKRDWKELKDEHELITMKKYASKSFSYLYIGSLIFPSMYNFIYIFHITNKTKLILPIRMEFALENNKVYYFFLLLEFIIIFIVCTIGVANYSLFMSITQHAFALFNIVLVKLDRPFVTDSHCLRQNKIFTSLNMEYDWIVTIIRSYEKAIRFISFIILFQWSLFVDLIKYVFGSTYLMEITLSLSLIVIDYLYIFTLKNTISENISDSTYILASMFLIYVYCYSGQIIYVKHLRSFKYVNVNNLRSCQVPFYTLSVKTQKILLILILQTMRPCNFSIRRIIVASHELFAKIENYCLIRTL